MGFAWKRRLCSLILEWGGGDVHKYKNNSTRDDKENRGILLYFYLIND